MSGTTQRVRAVLVGAFCFATGGCNEAITSVCGATTPARLAFDANRLDLNGAWDLLRINNEVIPPSGYDLPVSDDRLRAGTLTFRATEAILSSCGKGNGSEILERGLVVAQYLLADATGAPKFPSKVYTASYEHDQNSHVITIRAAGEVVSGTRNELDAMTFAKGHVIFGDYSLRFER
jgi:hypothetical protein